MSITNSATICWAYREEWCDPYAAVDFVIVGYKA